MVAALSLAFIPTMAQAVATTLDVQNGLSSAVDLESGDTLDVTVAGPIAKTGPAVHELYATWSAQSLGLVMDDSGVPEDDVTWPEGWNLEYTLDGTSWIDWAVTQPTNVADIIAIRSLGDVNTVGENTFKTTSTGALRALSFAGSGGGDGYDVAIGNDKVFNFWHHQSPQNGGTQTGVTIECHTFSGELCATPEFVIEDYSSNHGSSIYSYDSQDKVFAYAMDDSKNFGVLCVDYTNDTPVGCGFDILGVTTVVTDFEEGFADYQDMGSSSRGGNIIWSIAGNGDLMCLDMSTAAPCSDNGWNVGTTDYAFDTGRVTALGGLVYWTLNNKLGCYNPATDGLCSGTSAITLTDTANRMPPLPVENTVGTVLGVCDVYSEQCIGSTGATFAFPATLGTFIDANPINWVVARQNAEQFAYANNRFYFETENDALDWGSNWVTCYDFETQAACAGFDGYIDEIVNFYSATIDSQIANCVWINGDKGNIYPLNATTGEVGCDLGDPEVELPYETVTPRMSCVEDGRVTAWESIVVNLPVGVSMGDVQVSFYDTSDPEDEDDAPMAVDGYVDLTPDASGLIDLSGLTSETTGTQPSIRIIAGDISDELAEQISATVTFVGEDPELCLALDASNHCETTVVADPPAGSIADGIVEGTSITRPTTGSDVGSKQTITLDGVNSADMCEASGLRIALPLAQLASTGVDAGTFAMAGFAVLAVGGVAVAATRRRKA